MSDLVFDSEVYRNYFLLMFRNIDTGVTKHYELYPGFEFNSASVLAIMRKHRIVSFNGTTFDVPLIMLACSGASTETIKQACDDIIVGKMKHWSDDFKAKYPASTCGKGEFNHIDLIEVAPGQASLKIYGGRMHSRRMQDLPIDPAQDIAPEMRPSLIEYCGNDLQTTIDLFRYLTPQIELREAMGEIYGVDLRSRSDAQIAEQVIRGRVQRDTGKWIERPIYEIGHSFKYETPVFVSFSSPEFRAALGMIESSYFYISPTGNVEMSDVLAKYEIKFGGSVYKMGIGGLHSQEKTVCHKAEGCVLVDRDVVSYYPAVIMTLGLYPEQMGPRFLVIYEDLVKRRLKAKATGDKVRAESLKITINGSFGKFGSKWSTLYSPRLLIQTTVTGQLCLMMLIEMLETNGIPVVSANTDGLVIKCPLDKQDTMQRVVWTWEMATGFETEETQYTAMYSRDVNNYVAVKKGGGVKLKGVFAPVGLMKNPTNTICIEAVTNLLTEGTPVEDTINLCDDVRKFVSIRKVNGGAVKNDEFLGKAIRWYYAKDCPGVIQYKGSGYTVARTEGARPLMLLPDSIPEDLDYDWYFKEAKDILADVGWKQ